MDRRLAAILAADVADYSALMNADEAATYTAWRTARHEAVDPSIDANRGRIVKHTGDGFLAEFPTVIAAVQCGVDIQTHMARRDDMVVAGRPLRFRIGINLGDIIVDEEDIHGDGVNIAARLEGIATAGGICISADVYHQVRNKPGFAFRDLGPQSLKNITSPVRAYAVAGAGAPAADGPPAPSTTDPGTPPSRATVSVETILDQAARTTRRRGDTVVGRDAEMRLLREAFAEAREGRGNLALIRGEAGIGKSSLAHAFTRDIDADAAVVAFGQCHETLGSPPFWPWLQVVKRLESCDAAREVTAANVFDTLAAAPSSTATHSTFSRDVGADQFLLFSRIDGVLAQYAALRPLVLVLDDLHWADRSSLLLLAHVCRRLPERPILIVGTYRDLEITRRHPLFEALGEINRQTTVRRIALAGLAENDVAAYVQRTVDRPLSPAVLKALYEKTEGNPLFMTEVTRILQQASRTPAAGPFAIEIPDGIQEAIGQRLNQLSETCSTLLGMASVIGRRFSLRELAGVLPDTDELEILQTLDEAVARGLVSEADAGGARFQFGHVLIRDILYDELSLARKIVLHRRVADALAKAHAAGADVSLGEVARHYYHALQGGQGEHAVRYAIEAGHHAMQLSAFDEARGYFEIALDVFDVEEPADPHLKAEVLYRVAQCMQGAGERTPRTHAMLTRCLSEARRHGQHRLFADVACMMTYVGRTGADVGRGLAAIDEALTLLDDTEPVLRAKVLAHRAHSLLFNGKRREAERASYEAIDVAAGSGDVSVHCAALCAAVLVLRNRPEKLSERIRLGERAVQLSADIDSADDVMSLDPREWLILSYLELGDIARVRRLVDRQTDVIERSHGFPVFKARYLAAGTSACLALFDGRWADAEASIEAASELGANSLDGGAEGVYGAQMFFLNRELGRLPMIVGALERLAHGERPMWLPGLLAAYTDLGRAEDAKRLFDQLTGDDFALVVDDELYLATLVYLTEACMAFDLSDAAGALYRRLIPWSGQMVSHPTAVCYGPVDLYLGMLCSQMNRLDEAEQLLEKAAALCAPSAPNIWQAHIRYRHAQVIRRHSFQGDGARYDSLVGEARAIATALGMVNLLARIERLDAAPNAGTAHGERNGLTRRELEVLHLIAQGKSNKVIAAELNRSLATIATHVRSILHKTHTANRTEAAAFANARRLFRDDAPPG